MKECNEGRPKAVDPVQEGRAPGGGQPRLEGEREGEEGRKEGVVKSPVKAVPKILVASRPLWRPARPAGALIPPVAIFAWRHPIQTRTHARTH